MAVSMGPVSTSLVRTGASPSSHQRCTHGTRADCHPSGNCQTSLCNPRSCATALGTPTPAGEQREFVPPTVYTHRENNDCAENNALPGGRHGIQIQDVLDRTDSRGPQKPTDDASPPATA